MQLREALQRFLLVNLFPASISDTLIGHLNQFAAQARELFRIRLAWRHAPVTLGIGHACATCAQALAEHLVPAFATHDQDIFSGHDGGRQEFEQRLAVEAFQRSQYLIESFLVEGA